MGMRTLLQSIPAPVINLIQTLRRQLGDVDFSVRHRVRPEDFSRQRQLTFPVVMLFTLQKTVKSIQRHLHEFLEELAGENLFEPVTPGAWTHARAKLKHTAFIELNASSVLPAIYGPEQSQSVVRWRGIVCWESIARCCACPTTRNCSNNSVRCKRATIWALPE